MNTELLNTFMTEALAFMALKAGTNVETVAAVIAADPEGNTAKRFAELVALAVANTGKILEAAKTGEPITSL